MTERRLIFFSTAGPDADNAAWRPFRHAARAVEAEVDAAIFLAGPATGLMRQEPLHRLEGTLREAYECCRSAAVPIWLAPG